MSAALTHPNTIRVFDFGHEAGILYMAMELLQGETLARRATRIRSEGGVFTEREAIEKAFPVISMHLVGGLQELRIYSEQSPGQGFAGAEADLEDVYFHHLTRHRPN